MGKIQIIVIEDTECIRHMLKRMLMEHDDVVLAGEAASVEEGVRLIGQKSPDLLLLDVELPDGNSFQLLDKLADPPAVIFISAHTDYAVNAFKVPALDYLVKPFSAAQLAEALNRFREHRTRAVAQRPGSDRLLALMQGPKEYFVTATDIAAVVASREYTTLFDVQGRTFVEKRPMLYWVDAFPADRFVLLDRSTLVNLGSIDHVLHRDAQQVELFLKAHKEPLVLGRTAAARLRACRPNA